MSQFSKKTTIFNVFVPNDRAAKYMKQKLTKLQRLIDESTIIVGDFNCPLSEMDISSSQKISKNIVELKSSINQLV